MENLLPRLLNSFLLLLLLLDLGFSSALLILLHLLLIRNFAVLVDELLGHRFHIDECVPCVVKQLGLSDNLLVVGLTNLDHSRIHVTNLLDIIFELGLFLLIGYDLCVILGGLVHRHVIWRLLILLGLCIDFSLWIFELFARAYYFAKSDNILIRIVIGI